MLDCLDLDHDGELQSCAPEPDVGCLPPADVTLPAQVLGHPDLIKRRPKESLKPGSNASN